jgi:hypothetical protein
MKQIFNFSKFTIPKNNKKLLNNLNKINLEGRNRSNVNGQGAKHIQSPPLSKKKNKERKKEKDKKSRYTKKQIFKFAKKKSLYRKTFKIRLTCIKQQLGRTKPFQIYTLQYTVVLYHISLFFFI